jgi:hypothetical protein
VAVRDEIDADGDSVTQRAFRCVFSAVEPWLDRFDEHALATVDWKGRIG